MCLAVAGRITERRDQEGTVDVRGNLVRTRLDLVPEAIPGDHVLVHAGFAITVISAEEAAATDQAFEELDRAKRHDAERA